MAKDTYTERHWKKNCIVMNETGRSTCATVDAGRTARLVTTVYFHLEFHKKSIRRTATEVDSPIITESEHIIYMLIM